MPQATISGAHNGNLNVAQCMQHPPLSTWKPADFQLYLVEHLSIYDSVYRNTAESFVGPKLQLHFGVMSRPGGVDRRISYMSVAATNGDFYLSLIRSGYYVI